MEKNEKAIYKYDDETHILYKHYFGYVSVEDIIETWNNAIEGGEIPSDVKGFILDYRKAHFKMDLDDHVRIAEYYRQNLNIFGNYRFAILTETPDDITIPVMVSTLDQGYTSRPFSTLERAVRWVLHG